MFNGSNKNFDQQTTWVRALSDTGHMISSSRQINGQNRQVFSIEKVPRRKFTVNEEKQKPEIEIDFVRQI